MFGKLMKYDLWAMGRLLVPFYIAAPILALLTHLLEFLSGNAFGAMCYGLIFALFVITCICIIMGSFVVLILQFYKTMIGSEGYLTYMLPVSRGTLLSSKLLSGMIAVVVSCIVAFISIILVMPFSALPDFFAELGNLLSAFTQPDTLAVGLMILVMGIVGLAQTVLQFDLAMALGQLMNKNKLLWSILYFFALQFVVQLITMLLALAGGSAVLNFGPMFVQQFDLSNISELTAMLGLLGLMLAYICAVAVGMYFTTDWLLRKKLNLE